MMIRFSPWYTVALVAIHSDGRIIWAEPEESRYENGASLALGGEQEVGIWT